MVFPNRGFVKNHGSGFTLLEMLLTVALLMALLGAVIFNFESLHKGADLDEGARQFEALVRFASAHAANSGRNIQFRFGEGPANGGGGAGSNSTNSSLTGVESNASPAGKSEKPGASDDLLASGPKFRVVWETDPVGFPGVFSDVPEAASFLSSLEERVRIETVRGADRPSNVATNDLSAMPDLKPSAPIITFFADGSSDSAEIVLASLDSADYHRMTIVLDGLTGAIRTRRGLAEDLVPLEWMGDDEQTNNAASEIPNNAGMASPQPLNLESGVAREAKPTEPDPFAELPPAPAAKPARKTKNAFDDDYP